MQLLPKVKPSLKVKLAGYLKRDAQFRRVYEQTRKQFTRANFAAHNWEHVYRDILNAIVIGEAERADMRLVLPAITMHDIGFLFGSDGPTHAAVGARRLPQYLRTIRVPYSTRDILHLAACIRTHKGSTFKTRPETLEARVVADADMLEKFGPFGVYQYIRTWTEFGNGVEETINDKLCMIQTYRLNTKTGRSLAEPGRKFVVNFFKTLERAYAPYR